MPYERSGSPSPLFYSYETGPAHIVMLGSYADYGKQSDQVRAKSCAIIHHRWRLQVERPGGAEHIVQPHRPVLFDTTAYISWQFMSV